MESMTRPCPYCETGCAECSHTGIRTVTAMQLPGGGNAVVHGNAPLTGRSLDAVQSIMVAAADYARRINTRSSLVALRHECACEVGSCRDCMSQARREIDEELAGGE